MNSVVLRKSGGFYICFDDDAIIISCLCNYKINNGRVGFPINAINKVTNLLENNSRKWENTVDYQDSNLSCYDYIEHEDKSLVNTFEHDIY